MAIFESTLKPKLIYVFTIADEKHKGCLKIGETTLLDGSKAMDAPNSPELNQSAKVRIDQYTKTAAVDYQLLYTECTLFFNSEKKTIGSFNDKQVHQVLERSGIQRAEFRNQGDEWYRTDLATVKKAIAAVKEGRSSLTATEITQDRTPVIFRPEQQTAIDKTLKEFKHGNRMLWNAKMRFGKTLSALQVVKTMQLTRTLILTHRPAVNIGWFEDFEKIFYDSPQYYYGSRITGEELGTMEQKAAAGTGKYVYFASMQDLRGSETVGGKFSKNNQVFACKWDLVIVDEAHEGTQTQLGQNVMAELTKQNPKVLQLSGTPFNLIDQYAEEEVYTWDYTMEQTAKAAWDVEHFGDTNPYAGLPTMNIYTYDLGRLLAHYTDEDVAFNFTEFLRVKEDGTFVHAKDVRNFLDMMTKEDKESCYPFANQEYRNNFKHTLWMVTGVKAAKALSTMLKNHPVFGNFGIVNVAGEGDEEIDTHDALKAVKEAIKENEYTITLSCGRLTTGVSVPEWTAVLMISGSFSTAASSYMQTIFRVQTPWECDGKRKEQCYVFDFAPDRTLKVIAETAKVSAKAGKTTEQDRVILGKFLNFCPVISFEGSKMKEKITADKLFTELKKVYVERVVRSGFEDNSLYNDELLKMDDLALQDFENLKEIIGTTKAMKKPDDIDINSQGLTKEEYEEKERLEKKKKKELTAEEKKRLEELQKAKKNRATAISILRGISIRMPLLIYGAELKEGIEDVTIENFTSLIDNDSWMEFMPKGVNKLVFANFRKYYDPDIFLEAGRRIRAKAEAADKMTVEQRIERITGLFANFRNPDKETVLTPWRVVNMHLGDTLGGYNFYNEGYTELIEEPRYVEHGNITAEVFNPNSHILEINSKTGLYPLYVAYSLYRASVKNELTSPETVEEQQAIWDKVVRDNVFVICKTKMAQSITKRTLVGFRNAKTNTTAFDDLVDQIANKPDEFIERIKKGQVFKNYKNMKFDAVVGNPPYQKIANGDANGSDPIYHNFIDLAIQLSKKGTLIHPARFLFNAGKTPKDWNKNILENRHFKVVGYYPNSTDVFPSVDVKGGIATTYWDNEREYSPIGIFMPHKELRNIVDKVRKEGFSSFSELVYPRDLYHLTESLYKENPWADNRQSMGHKFDVGTNVFEIFPELFTDTKPDSSDEYIQIYGRLKNERVYKWVKRKYITSPDNLDFYKIFIPKSNGSGAIGEVLSTPVVGQPVVGQPVVGHTVTFLSIGKFDTEKEASNVLKYIKSKFCRALLGSLKVTQDNPKEVWANIPMQDFSEGSDIRWTGTVEEIDRQLYAKYGLDVDEIAFIEEKVREMK